MKEMKGLGERGERMIGMAFDGTESSSFSLSRPD